MSSLRILLLPAVICLAAFFTASPVCGQVAINPTGNDPDPSAMLDITSTDRGLLIPRLTTLQLNAITTPANGLLVYDTDALAFRYHDGSLWRLLGDGASGISGPNLTGISSISSPIPSASAAKTDAANYISSSLVPVGVDQRQSFTAQQSGNLAVIQLTFDDVTSGDACQLFLYAGDYVTDVLPGGALAQWSFTDDTSGIVSFTATDTVPVTAGQVYTLVLAASANVFWLTNTSGSDPYSGGRASTGPGDDFVFTTSVRTPVGVFAVDATTGNLSVAGGAFSIIGSAAGQLSFNASTGAIQAGVTGITDYSFENAGAYSTSFGHNTLASGSNAFAIGNLVTASGDLSFAAGKNSIAGGRLSLAMGDTASATAQASVAIGDHAVAGDLEIAGVTFPGLAIGSVALGKDVSAKGLGAFALGQDTTAIGTLSFAMGNQALTQGENAFAVGNRAEAHGARSAAIGDRVKAYGDASVAMGLRNNAQSFAEFVVGSYTPDYIPASTIAWDAGDRLFVIGNGPDSSHRSTALIVYKSGAATLTGKLTLTDGTSAFTLPNTDGTAGQVLSTDGLGNVAWADGGGTGTSPVLSLSGNTLSLGSGGSVDLSKYLDNTDAQTLSLNGSDLTLSNGGGTISINDADSSPTNEIQTLSLNGSNLTLSNGGGTVSVNDADSSSTNELQALSQAGGVVTLSNGGGSVSVPWSTSGNDITNTNSGNIGIGVSPAAKLDVNGVVRLRGGSPANGRFLKATNSSGDAVWSALDLSNLAPSVLVIPPDAVFAVLDGSPAVGKVLTSKDNSGSVTWSNTLSVASVAATGSVSAASVIVSGGSPAAGKVLTATNASGAASWQAPYSPNNGSTFSSTQDTANGTSGWKDFGISSPYLNGLVAGDKVMIVISARIRIDGGSGSDDLAFRIRGVVGGSTYLDSSSTGLLEHYDQNRNNWQPLTFHRVLTIVTPGNYYFRVQLNVDNTDDDIDIDDEEITVIKL